MNYKNSQISIVKKFFITILILITITLIFTVAIQELNKRSANVSNCHILNKQDAIQNNGKSFTDFTFRSLECTP